MTAGTDGRAHKQHLEKLARRGAASVFGAGFSAVSGVALVVIVTQGFSAALAGTLFAATSAFLIIEAFVLLGTDTGLVRWLPAQLATQRPQDARRTLAVAVVPVLGVALLTATALFALAPWLAPVLVGEAQKGAMATMLRVLSVALPFAALHHVVLAATRGLGTMRPTVLIESIARLALQALAILIALVAGSGAQALAVAWSAPYVLALAWSGWWLGRLLRRSSAPGSASPHAWGVAAREFWRYTSPRAVARITQTGLKRSDIVLVAALASPADAALYTAATRFVVVGQLLVQAVQQALAPQMSGLFARSETEAADSVFKAATVWSMVTAWPIYLVAAGFAQELMAIFGPGYDDAYVVVVVLSLTMLFATACGPVDSVLLMAGRSWLSLANSTVALVVNVGLNVVLIPRFGITGAAAAWSVAIVVRNLLPLVQVRSSLRMWPVTIISGYVAAAAVAWFGAASGITHASDAPTVVGALLVLAATAGYLTSVYLLKEPLELDAFASSLRRRGGRRPQPAAGPTR